MMILIMGGRNSGKSAAAEKLACEYDLDKYYLATMIPQGQDGLERVERHRRMRDGKGFLTIERPFDIQETLAEIDKPREAVVLLECVANLLANELFERKAAGAEETVDRLFYDIIELSGRVGVLLVVSDVFEDSDEFDGETRMYVNTLDKLNRKLMSAADEVIRHESV